MDFHPDVQMAVLTKLGREFGKECPWSPTPTVNRDEFYTENDSFSFGCAAGTHCMIRHFKPRHVIEIGSGRSSRIIAGALQRNAMESHVTAEYTIIDPYPSPEIESGLPGVTRLVKQRVECQEMALFDRLEANDVLFIDSGHTVRIGGDVNFLILDVLPRLAPGVIG